MAFRSTPPFSLEVPILLEREASQSSSMLTATTTAAVSMLAPHRAPPTTIAQRAPSPQMMAGKSQMYESTRRKAGWLPGSDAPMWLDGSLAGDVGFDPYCLVAMARTGTAVGLTTWTNVEPETQMVIMSDYERKRKVTWTPTRTRTLAPTRALTLTLTLTLSRSCGCARPR